MTEAQRGRILVLGVIICLLGTSLLVMIVTGFVLQSANVIAQVVRFVISTLLCVTLYFGATWVRWLFVVLLLVSGVVSSAIGVSLVTSNAGALFLLVLGLVYLASGLVLALSSSVKTFLAYQAKGLSLTADADDL